jgi:flagellar biosynthetic protein FliR
MTPILVAGLPGLPPSASALVLLLVSEAIIGGFIGIISQVLVSAQQTAGTLIAYLSSMANALIQDPIAEQQSSTIANFLTITGMTVIFVTDTHHLMLRAMADSYLLFIPGQPLDFGVFIDVLSRRVAASFTLGVQLAAPFLVTAMTYYIGLGLLGRLMPALPVFFVGLPIQIAMQIALLALTVSAILMAFLTYFQEGMGSFLAP